jgi:NAD(P)-dependent dehydrogenase (short-subunit alcohol dehydrogenase family)
MRAPDSPRAVIVTGGGSGIGRSCAVRLAADGFAVGVLDVDAGGIQATVEEIGRRGGSAMSIRADVRQEQEVADAVGSVERELGPLFGLVNSAGILHYGPSLELDLAEWRRLIDVNLTGAFICDRAAARAMVARGAAGRIINIASVHSQSPSAGLAAYDASKGGVWMLTRSLALELAPHGITVNAVGPGLVIQTNLGGGTSEEYLNQVVPAIPLGRAGLPPDISGPVSFLCSEDAGYVTGAMLFVDGGMLLTART